MYCLLCHAKIPRLRAWRTKSEFCCDEHAEAYKNQMLDRLMVNDSDPGETKAEKTQLSAKVETGESKIETVLPPREPDAAPSSRSSLGGGMLGLSSSPEPSSRQSETPAPEAPSQTAEEALAALRELAESAAQRSKGKARPDPPPVATPAGDPLGEMELSETAAPSESENVFDELRELAGRALPADVDQEGDEGTAEGADDLDMVTRSSALERLMQEAVSADHSEPSEADESLAIDALLGKDTEQEAEPVAQASSEVEVSVSETAPLEAESPLEEAAAEEQQPATAAEPEVEEAAQAQEVAVSGSSEASADPGEPGPGAGRGNVVTFPAASAEEKAESEEEEPPQAAKKAESKPSPGRAPDQTKVARSSEQKKAAGHPLLRGRMTLEPLLDFFSMNQGEPAIEQSQQDWDLFVRELRGGQTSLKEVNGVIQAHVSPAYPPGPQPARAASDLASEFALLDTLPHAEDGPRFEMQPAAAEIADFDTACVHPELVFLNFSLSTTQANGLIDVTEGIAASTPLPSGEAPRLTGAAEGQIAEPGFMPSVPSGFLLRCGDLSLSEEPNFVSGELLTMGVLSGEGSRSGIGPGGFSAGVRNLNQPSIGTEFPDGLFGGVEDSGAAAGRLTTGDLAGAEPASRDLPPGAFPPMGEAGQGPSGKTGARGIFEPVFETKRPMDRDLSDYV